MLTKLCLIEQIANFSATASLIVFFIFHLEPVPNRLRLTLNRDFTGVNCEVTLHSVPLCSKKSTDKQIGTPQFPAA